MWSWISKIDPNALLGLVVLVGTYVYHRLSPSTQASVSAALATAQKDALAVADTVMGSLTVAAAMSGMSADSLASQLWAEARIQLGHIGMNTDALPPAVISAVQALVDKYVAQYKAAHPVGQVVVTLPKGS